MAEEITEERKVFNLAEGKFEDEPAKETPEKEEKKPEEDVEEPEKKEAEKPEEEEVEPSKKEEEEEEEEEPKKEPELKFEPNTYIKEKYGEKFGIESEEELAEILDAQDELLDKYKELEAKAKEPKYRTEQEKKVAEFLQGYDPAKFGEGLSSISSLMGMDPNEISEVKAYKEAYILDHPHLTRDEAAELAEDEFEKKYSINKDDFDDDAAYEKRKRILDIQKKDAVSKARKVLIEKKEALKTPSEEKKEPEKAPEKPESRIPQETIQEYHTQIDKFFKPSKDKSFNSFQFMDDDGKTVLYNMKLDKSQTDQMQEFMKKYVQTEGLYDKNGKIPKFDPLETAKIAHRVLFGDEREEQLWKQIKVLARTMKAEQVASKSPDKKSGGSEDQTLNPMDQFRKQADQAKQKRGG